MKTTRYYPVFADLRGRRCLVIGGGPIAQRKVSGLLRCGADVIVVSPTVSPPLSAAARSGRIRRVARRFRPSDVQGAWLVCAATDDERINEAVFRAASQRQILTNVVDRAALCSFIAPAIFRRGPLTVAVSTGGGSPALAKKVRSDIARLLGREYVPMLQLLRSLRIVAKRALPTYQERKRYFERLVHGRVFDLVRAGRLRAARTAAVELLERHGTLNGRN